MRLFLIPLVLLAFAGCDQAAPDSARANVKTTDNGDGEGGGSSALNNETFWFGDGGRFDAQFTLDSSTPSSRAIRVQMLDGQGRALATYGEARDHFIQVGGGPEQMAVSGPLAQSWPMMVCTTDSLDDIPEYGHPDCEVLATNTGAGMQFLGASSENMTSIHYKNGRTIFDFTSESGPPAVFYMPDELPEPGAQPDPSAMYRSRPSVNYVVMTPVGGQDSFRPHGIRLSWDGDMEFDCSLVSHSGVNGECPNSGRRRRTSGGF